jgi:hypothetical protein
VPAEILTKEATEAEFEAKIRAAILKAFPRLPESALTHQIRFSFAIGRARIETDGAANAEGRIDVLVQLHGKPLAVFELKRPGIAHFPFAAVCWEFLRADLPARGVVTCADAIWGQKLTSPERPLLADTVEKVENRGAPKISRTSNVG